MMDKPSHILVCGGREFFNRDAVYSTLGSLRPWFAKEFCIIHGGAAGADTLAGDWAKSVGVCEIVVLANWNFYNKAAGTIRNKWMADFCKPDLCIHFPGGTGTARMVTICTQLGIETYGPR